MWPIPKLFLGENGFEQLKGSIFVRIAFHVEIDKSTELPRATQQRAQLGREMGNRVRRIGWIDLRIERRNFNRKIYDRETFGIFTQRIGPASCFARETLQ